MRSTTSQIATNVLHKHAAKVETALLPHQKRVIDRLRGTSGLVVAHGVGTGKTLSSLAAAEEADSALAMVPAALVANYEKEMQKHLRGRTKTKVRSAQTAVLRQNLTPTDLLILDEAHRARETGTKIHQHFKHYPAKKRMLLTASPVYNRPSDIAALVNLAAQDAVLPTGAEFNKQFIKRPAVGWGALLPWAQKKPTLKNKKKLQKILRSWVDYHNATGQDFPRRRDSLVQVEMSPTQSDLHDMAWGKLPLLSRLRIQSGLPPNKKDLASINQFQSQARQVSGSLRQFGGVELTPKLERALKDLKGNVKKPRHRAVVYSNYLDTLGEYGKALDAANIPYEMFTGKKSQKERKRIVQDYNKGRIKTLLISSAGGEGLDLKGTRQIQVLEPHWNDEKLHQVIGRAIRHKSHAHLPKKEREVHVQRYLTNPRPGLLRRIIGGTPTGVEQVLFDLSKNKTRLNEELLDLLQR